MAEGSRDTDFCARMEAVIQFLRESLDDVHVYVKFFGDEVLVPMPAAMRKVACTRGRRIMHTSRVHRVPDDAQASSSSRRTDPCRSTH